MDFKSSEYFKDIASYINIHKIRNIERWNSNHWLIYEKYILKTNNLNINN